MSDPLKIVIIGGVAGGASAATRARRLNEQAQIVLLEKDEYVSFANCGLPYHIGEEIAERGKLLVATKEMLNRRFNLDVRTRSEATAINREAKTVTVLNHESGETYELPYGKLILSPGAAPLVPPIPGIDAQGVFTLRNVADMDHIKSCVDQASEKRAIVVGAGFIGLEMVEQLVRRGFDVALAEMQPQVLPPFDREMVTPIHEELQTHGVEFVPGDAISAVLTDSENRATGIELASGRKLTGGLVIMGLGVRPNTQLAQQAGLEIGETGGVLTNEFRQTNDPDIYAVGDVSEYTYGPTGKSMRVALAGPANRAGRLAGQHAATGSSDPMADVYGTAIVRVFEQTAAMTGLSEKLAARSGVEATSVTIVAGQHAGYFPGATPITLKLVYDPKDGRVLGAQAVGKDGIDKRIDVIATSMSFKATVRDLAGLDLCYAPPFGSAKDPIHQAAFAACNALDGFTSYAPVGTDLAGKQVVDVRTSGEVERAPLQGAAHAMHVPVDELRDRLDELDATKETVVTCAVGLRGHVATRILRQRGFENVKNLTGGATLRNRNHPDE
ncbi:MAG: FAD-dependent oxidoreductase [Planctomycetaceae bacterium]|nr:FAD-dependent oxidoreductase [Planctomycetaceae bacterium]